MPGAALAATAVAVLAVMAAGWPGRGDAAGSAEYEKSCFIGLVNQYRAQNGTPPLKLISGLSAASQWMAEDSAGPPVRHTTVDTLGRGPAQR